MVNTNLGSAELSVNSSLDLSWFIEGKNGSNTKVLCAFIGSVFE